MKPLEWIYLFVVVIAMIILFIHDPIITTLWMGCAALGFLVVVIIMAWRDGK